MDLFDPSKFDTEVKAQRPEKAESMVFDPKKAKDQLLQESEKAKREKLTAMDPNQLLVPTEDEIGPLKAWSFSTLKSYEECPYRMYLKKVEKIPEDSGPAADRGSKIHDMAESYVDGSGDFRPELKKFKAGFEELRRKYDDPQFKMELEQNWGFTPAWKVTGWTDRDTWCRQKLDVFYRDSATSAVIIDHKTGKKFGNELKHGEQGLHYAIGAFKRYPDIDYVQAKFWYLDKGEVLTKNYTRERALIHLPKIQKRAVIMTTARDFPPRPSKSACKWCSYAEDGSCDFAYVE